MNKSEDILKQFDDCASTFTFPMMDNGYVYLAGTKLTAFRDDLRWAIIIEVIGFNYRGGAHYGIENCLYVFGNCLSYEPGIRNENFLFLTKDSNECETFDEEGFDLNSTCSTFLLRDEVLPIVHDREVYKASGINLEDEEKINAFEFLRLLEKLYHDKLIATDFEIKDRIPSDLPKILELDSWFHPDLIENELPGKNETFIQIAKVLETGDISFYKPTNAPNTHWANWPFGGTL